MRCDPAQEAISALLDGGPCEVDRGALEAHLASCASCRAWQEAAHQLTRVTRLQRRPAPRPPARLYAALHNERAGKQRAKYRTVTTSLARARTGLMVVALGQLALSVQLLVLGEDLALLAPVARQELHQVAGVHAGARGPQPLHGLLERRVGRARDVLRSPSCVQLSPHDRLPLLAPSPVARAAARRRRSATAPRGEQGPAYGASLRAGRGEGPDPAVPRAR